MFWNKKNKGLRILFEAMRGNKNAIEESEARGQKDAVEHKRLPINASLFSKDTQSPKEKYEAMGIKIISKYDEFFYNVELPSNIEIRATEHPMYNELVKDRKVVATFFFKASIYDYDAFIDFN